MLYTLIEHALLTSDRTRCIRTLLQINILAIEQLNIFWKTRSVHLLQTCIIMVCFKSLSHGAFYVAKYKSSFVVSQLMHLILPNRNKRSSSRRWNRRYLIQLIAVYLIRFWSDFGHHKNLLLAIEVLNLKMAYSDSIQPIASSVS